MRRQSLLHTVSHYRDAGDLRSECLRPTSPINGTSLNYLLGSESVLIVISVYFKLRLTDRTGQLLQLQIPCRNLNYPMFNFHRTIYIIGTNAK